MGFLRIAGAIGVLLMLASCAGRPPAGSADLRNAYVDPASAKVGTSESSFFKSPPRGSKRSGPLTGRTLTVASLSDIALSPGEVVLTFDDGPVPGNTTRILDTLDDFHVKATFLMVGQMADSHPATARAVVARGHSIGSHTYRHPRLDLLSFDMAMTEIIRGDRAVARATGLQPGFFRFPYLADTAGLREALGRRGSVVLDVDIDSKDYFKTSPAAITNRVMAALERRGRGIILLHDIHSRTASMLASLLIRLEAGGYKVVTLRMKRERRPEGELFAAR